MGFFGDLKVEIDPIRREKSLHEIDVIFDDGDIWEQESDKKIDSVTEGVKDAHLQQREESIESFSEETDRRIGEDTLLIGVGGCGVNFVHFALGKANPENCCVIESEIDPLEQVDPGFQKVKYFDLKIGKGKHARQDARAAFPQIEPDIRKALKESQKKEVLIVFGSGGGLGGVVSPLVQVCQELGLTTKVGMFHPFEWEAGKEPAMEASTKESKEWPVARVVTVENERILEILSRKDDMSRGFLMLNVKMLEGLLK